MITPIPTVLPAGPTSTTSFREPAREAPLWWGPYSLRYTLGLVLIWLGPLLVVREMAIFYTRYSLSSISVAAELLGYALLVVGWLVLPGRMSRRAGAAAIALVSVLVYAHGLPSLPFLTHGRHAYEAVLHGYWGVPAQLAAVVGMLTAWLLVRERPGPTWALLPMGLLLQLVLSVGDLSAFFFFDSILPGVRFADWQSALMVHLALGWVVLVVVPAWAARLLAPSVSRDSAARQAEGAVRAAALVEQRAQFTDGQPTRGIGPAAAWDPSRTTNTFAILALIFGILGGYLAVVFGHIARSQIRKTGQGGSGMATAGLVLGYLWVAASVMFVIYVVVVVAQGGAGVR